MPRRKKKTGDMSTEELARSVFPRKAIAEMKKLAQERDNKRGKKPSRK